MAKDDDLTIKKPGFFSRLRIGRAVKKLAAVVMLMGALSGGCSDNRLHELANRGGFNEDTIAKIQSLDKNKQNIIKKQAERAIEIIETVRAGGTIKDSELNELLEEIKDLKHFLLKMSSMHALVDFTTIISGLTECEQTLTQSEQSLAQAA